MRLKHKIPCAECPWRRKALQGFMGGHDPLVYADAVRGNEITACHLQDHGPDSDKTAMCAGALAVAANSCTMPHKTEGGQNARDIVGRNSECFSHPAEFYKYHTGKDYVHPLLRSQ